MYDRLVKVILNGGLTEWLRSLIGNQVRCNSPVGSSPMSSAIKRNGCNHLVTAVFYFINIQFDNNFDNN